MGNQQSGGTQICSRGELYTHRPQMTGLKCDPETRVGYSFSTQPKFQVQKVQKSKFQVQRFQKQPQQVVPKQQQVQEDVKEITMSQLSGVGKLKIQKSVFETETQAGGQSEDDMFTFDGVFGKIIISMKGPVLYTDITGKQHREYFDKETIEKIFPMGISFGGFTRSIWFKDGVSRDEAFQVMISMPPSCKAKVDNSAMYELVENEANKYTNDDNMKIFEGLNKNNVIVHADNLVLYTDLEEKKHCVSYDKHSIEKCFPKGICFGGLPKAIWFSDQMERDLCFMLMQWNLKEGVDESQQESPIHKYNGLYGGVVLHSDSQIEYTSFTGDNVKCFYEPDDILETFPMGISFGRLPKTIWFQDVEVREKCIDAMRSK